MIFNRYVSRASNLFAENRLLKFVVLVLAGVLIVVMMNTARIASNQKVVIVPAGLSERAEVGDSYADERYLTAMGVYIGHLMYSTTAASVEGQYKLLCGLFDTEAYAKYSQRLMKAAYGQKKNGASFSFKTSKVVIETEPRKEIRLEVSVDKYIMGNKVSQVPEQRVLVIGFLISGGKFLITSLEEEAR